VDSLEESIRKYNERKLNEEKNELSKNADTIRRFKELCSEKGLRLLDENFRYIYTIGIIASYPNILPILNPQIELDKEDLINFALLNTYYQKKSISTGFLYGTDYMVMAHPYFRRGFQQNTNFAPRFIDLFWRLNPIDMDLYIAIDLNRVRINVDNSMYMELDTWYGARFDKSISLISNGLSKLRPPLDLNETNIQFLFNNAYSLDTLWETNNNIKTFQAEEFKTEEVRLNLNGTNYFPSRYIHAEFDLNIGFFRHFDGALHLYNEEEYYERRDSDFNYNRKHDFYIKSNSRKLFKMNGKVSVDNWIQFSSHFLTGNPLIIEYFEGKYPDKILEILEKIRKKK
jgi:hypothetical protein